MSFTLSRRSFLTASAVSTMLLARPLSAFGFSTVEQEQISALFAEKALSLALKNHLFNFCEIERQDLLEKVNLSDVGRLRGWIKSRSGKRVVGAVGSDFYPVLESLMREANGALLFHGRHVVSANHDTRHSFYTTPASQGAGAQLIASLVSAKSHCQVSEYCIGADDQIGFTRQSLNLTDNWLAAIANVLVSVAGKRWQATSVEPFQTTHLAEEVKAVDSLETFVFSL